jgi:rare lipoprotein A
VVVTLDESPQNRPADRNIPEPQVYPNSAFSPVVTYPPDSSYQDASAAGGAPQVSRQQLSEPAYPASPIYHPVEGASSAPQTAQSAQNAPVPSMQDGTAFISPPRAEQVPLPPAVIKPAIPPAGDGKSYRIQVGSFKVPRNAADAFERLRKAGLNPAYERAGEFYRVVIAQVRSDDVQTIAGKLGAAGFREALIRAED